MDSLYATDTTDTTFGYKLQEVLAAIAERFGCHGAGNCTAEELAYKQWGSSAVTLSPQVPNGADADPYTAASSTVARWGNFSTPGAPAPLEFRYYAEMDPGALTLSETQIRAIMSTCVPCFGLNNLYNAARFVVAYETEPAGADISLFLQAYGLGVGEGDLLLRPARRLVQEYLFGGWNVTSNVDAFIKGLATWQYADRVNGGDFRYGDAWAVAQFVTPVFNTVEGAMSNQTLGIRSGGQRLEEVSSVGLINGERFINRREHIFDGVSYRAVHRSASGHLGQLADPLPPGASNGVQFAPEQLLARAHDDTLRLYDSHNLKVDLYGGRRAVQKGDDGHTYYTYSIANMDGHVGQDVSLAYHLNYKMFGKDCYGCDNALDALDFSSVYVNGSEYRHAIADTAGPFLVEVEPHTGIMTRRRKQVTVVFSLACEQGSGTRCASPVLPFPALENLQGASLPMFELTEDIQVDYASLQEATAFIRASNARVRAFSVALTAMAFAAFLLAAGFLFIHTMNTPVEPKDGDLDEAELERRERLKNIERLGDGIQLDDSMDGGVRFIVA